MAASTNTTTEIITRGLVQLPPDSERVTDVDEEVFVLYSNLQTSTSLESGAFRGLGDLDSHKDTLAITFELRAQPINTLPPINTTRRKAGRKPRKAHTHNADKAIEIELAQDKTALHSRKGDTGSVLWKASIDFAQLILQQTHVHLHDCLLDPSRLRNSHIVELGAGTGLLSIALSPLVCHYTVTDIKELIPLIRKNVAHNFPNWSSTGKSSAPGFNITIEELNWLTLHSTPSSRRPQLVNLEPIDLLLLVDCIYHPSLLPALVETIDHLTTPNQTAVLVVVELRAADVVREFLALWIQKPNWEVWRVGGDLLGKPYVMWVGWCGHADSF